MNLELVRIVDGIARDKSIDRESIFLDLEDAMASAARKQFGMEEEVEVKIDRENGEIQAFLNGDALDIRKLGRIPAQTAKQVMIQKLRADERESIYTEYNGRVGEICTGTIGRHEGGATLVNLGRAEAILPRSEQIPGETHHPGERTRGIIIEVSEAPGQVKIVVSRTHPDFIRRLFEQEVPEVSERIIEIKALAREAGYRSKVAVVSLDSKVDAVGACVGVRGSRIKNIVDELGGEKIDIVRWNESSQILIANALRPAEVRETAICFELNRATVVVDEDQLSLAIGKRGQNVRLAARLSNWDIDILTPKEYTTAIEALISTLRNVEEIDDTVIDKVMALGIVSVLDMEEVGTTPLMEALAITEELAAEMVKCAAQEARRQVEEKEKPSAAQSVLEGELGDRPAGPAVDNGLLASISTEVVVISADGDGTEAAPGATTANESAQTEVIDQSQDESVEAEATDQSQDESVEAEAIEQDSDEIAEDKE